MEIALFIGFLVLLRFIIRDKKTYKIILSVILLLAAIPAGIFVEMGLNGCCGASSTGFEGVGYVPMAILFLGGLALFITTIRRNK